MAKITKPKLDAALTEQELNELDAFLNSEQVGDFAMSLEAIDGYFCALALAPDAVMPSQWFPVIWGGEQDDMPAFETEQQAARIFELLVRHWNTVNGLLRQKPKTADDDFYIPLMEEPDEEVDEESVDSDYGQDWANGFRQGMAHSAIWDALFDEEPAAEEEGKLVDLLSPVVLLSCGANPETPEKRINLKERKELAIMLVPVAYTFFEHWHGKAAKAKTAPKTKAHKPGRNDLCACGSGKKYKKCCGDSSRTLH